MVIFLSIVGVVAAFLLVLVFRALAFRPKKQAPHTVEEVSFDADRSVETLAELVKCRTVSFYDHSLEDEAEFSKLIGKLPELFPNVARVCELTTFPDRGLLYRWKGTGTGDPAVFMAHYDVVPVEQDNWSVPAFSALIKDGVMWGRGTVDTKNTFNGVLSAADNLIRQGFVPKDDIYFAFSGGEEINGDGARHIVDYFASQRITPSLVLDEGGAVVEGMFPGVKEATGLIGIAEKGMMNLNFECDSAGGHASAPGPHTPVGILSSACVKVEANPFKMHMTKPVQEMFDTLGRHSSFVYRLIFSNMWLFRGILDGICKKGGGEMNAMMRTTVAFTQMDGSLAPNVIPPTAKMVANMRLNPEDSVAGAIEYVKSVIKDDRIKLSVTSSMEPSPISRTDVDGWKRIASAVADTWKGCIVAPYLMVQCSDSRHYAPISDRVYKFSAADLTPDERHGIHGNDEHIRIETVKHAVEFFIRVMKQC